MPSSETDAGMPPPYPHGHPQSMPQHQRRYPPQYGGHPPPGHMPGPPHGGYHYGPPPPASQYGNTQGGVGIPPHQWTGGMPPGHPPPPGPPAPPPGQSGAYPPPGQRSLSPERSSNWNGYRGAPTPHKVPQKSPNKEEDAQYWHGQTPGAPPHYDGQPPAPASSYHSSGYGSHPAGWQGGHSTSPVHSPSAPPPSNVYSGPWTGKTPPRRQHRDQYSSRHDGEVGSYVSRGQQSHVDDDCASSSAGGSTKDKGRGSYKCGRCGVPKKGHVCPYQPKLKRRPDEPPPETRNAAVQVEMDEFMTLRRLNIRIQGFPESYVTEPYMSEMVVGEASNSVPHGTHSMENTRPNIMLDAEQRMTLDSINTKSSRHSSSPMRDAAVGEGNLNDDRDEQAI